MPVHRIALIAAVVTALSGAAAAQVPVGLTPQLADQAKMEQNLALSAARFQSGVDALQAKNFAVAELVFDDVLKQNPTHPEANFMMGVTQMSLARWEAAKKYLAIAVDKKPKEPDPRSRLGVTLAKLGDVEGAKTQRDALVKMDRECKQTCKNAQWIGNGIAMIDQAMPPKP